MKLPLTNVLSELSTEDKNLYTALLSVVTVVILLLLGMTSCAITESRERINRTILDCRSTAVNRVESTDTLDLICGKLPQ
jgi:ABC-type arginine transport system permease subunit